jgi:hypothetical protein
MNYEPIKWKRFFNLDIPQPKKSGGQEYVRDGDAKPKRVKSKERKEDV